jgi:hypothetical protein
MVSRGTFLGVTAVFVALLLVVSLTAGYYYLRSQQEATSSATYAAELNVGLSENSALAKSLATALRQYNTTLVFLAQAVSNMNTTTPAYQNASQELPVLWSDYLALAQAGRSLVASYSVDMLVDYGNGSLVWYNATAIQPGWNLYTATLVGLHDRVQATWYSYLSGGEDFIDALNGVTSSATTSWFLWVRSGNSWQIAPTGANLIPAYNGTIFAWTLCGYNQDYLPTCEP